MAGRTANYKIKCLKDGRVFDTIEEAGAFYGKSRDAIQWRLSDGVNHKDGWNWEKVWDNTEALKTVEAVDSKPFVDKFGDKTIPLPGYEDRYTISTRGVITKIANKSQEVVKVKTKVTVKNTVILHGDGGWSQTHNVENLMKKAFGDPDAVEAESENSTEETK